MKKKSVAILRKGRVIAIYSSTGNASRCMGCSDTTIRNYIANNTRKGDLSFRFATEEETRLIRLLGGLPEASDDDKDETSEPITKESKYDTIPYETLAGKLCITPCPHRTDIKPKIGSSQCVECPFFHGRDREKQLVKCSAVGGKTWKKTRERVKMEEEI